VEEFSFALFSEQVAWRQAAKSRISNRSGVCCASRGAFTVNLAPDLFPVDSQQEETYFPVGRLKERHPWRPARSLDESPSEEPPVTPPSGEVLQGTLDLIVLKTLDAMGPQHGYGIAVRIQQVSEDLLKLNQGTLYPALLRLEQRGWISSKWGVSENNRKAKFYTLTRSGRRQLATETESWERMAAVIQRLLGTQGA
jgi:PadR family transcriptional regulator PadR